MKKFNLCLIFAGIIFVNQTIASDLEVKKVEDIFDAVVKCQSLSQEDCTSGIAKFKKQINQQRDVLVCQSRLYVDYKKSHSGITASAESKMTPLELAVNAGMVKATIGLLKNGAAPDFQKQGYDSSLSSANGNGAYLQYTFLHQLAEWAQKKRDPAVVCIMCGMEFTKSDLVRHEIVWHRDIKTYKTRVGVYDYSFNKKMTLGVPYVGKEEDYLLITKLLVDAAGPTLLDKKGSLVHPSKADSAKLFNTDLKTNMPITAAQLCGDAPGAVCDYLRKMRPNQVTSEVKEQIKTARDEFEQNIYGMQLRQTEYPKCSFRRPFEKDKNKLTNDELVKQIDAGCKICQSSDY